ncbi:hypothetical protein ACF0H5_016414 [Mactra antiquata]
MTVAKPSIMDSKLDRPKVESVMGFVKRNLLVILTIVGVIFGLALGFGVREARPSTDAVMWIGLPGELYMNMLKMMILPLIISTVITGTAALNPKSQGRVSGVSVAYIAISNTIPPIIGAIIVLIINPGADVTKNDSGDDSATAVMQTQDIFADLIRNLFPDNLILAAFQQTITKYEREDVYDLASNETLSVVSRKYLGRSNGTNVLGLIICCTLFGVGTASVGQQGKPFLTFFQSASEIILRILQWLVWFTPVGVASLIAKVLAKTTDLEETFRHLGMFILASMLGLCIFMFVVVPIMYAVIVRRKPFKFFMNMIRPLMITFATASSAIAIPDTLFFMEKKNKIDKRITRFVVPFASALNKSGSALYIAASCVFICQLEKVPTDAAQVLIIIILTSLSTFAVPSVPSAGIVTIMILLTAMNIPSEAVGLLLAIEWFLDRCRTAGNLYSQILCVAVTQKFAALPPLDSADNELDPLDCDFEVVVDNTSEVEKTPMIEKEKLKQSSDSNQNLKAPNGVVCSDGATNQV